MDAMEMSKSYEAMLTKHVALVDEQIAKRATPADIKEAVSKSEADLQAFVNKAIGEMKQTIEAEKATRSPLVMPGQKFIENEIFVSKAAARATMNEMVPTDFDVIRMNKAAAGDIVSGVPVREFVGVMPMISRATPFIDAVPSAGLEGNAVNYLRQTTRIIHAASQYNAAAVSTPNNQGEPKKKSTMEFAEITAGLQTIAHISLISRQSMEDYEGMAQLINTDMVYGVRLEVERQLLSGTNSNGEIQGIIPVATAYDTGYNVSGDQGFDTIGHGLMQLSSDLFVVPTAIVMSPSRWQKLMLIKDGDQPNKGAYILGGPGMVAQQQLWGTPVITTHAMADDKFLVANLILGSRQRTKGGMMVGTYEQDDKNIQRNMVTVRAELRLLQQVNRPDYFVYGTFPS